MEHWVASRRFGYGGLGEPPEAWTLSGMLGQISTRQDWPVPIGGAEGRKRLLGAYTTLIREARGNSDLINERFYVRRQRNALVSRAVRADAVTRIVNAATSPTPFRERIASFWLNHFAVSSRRNFSVGAMVPLFEAEAIRPFLSGYFGDMLRAVAVHPAMVMFLDQHRSVGPSSPRGRSGRGGLNENLGREILELHTLGIGGGYSQEDVLELSLLLTGLRTNFNTYETQYLRSWAQPGKRTILGRSYGGIVRNQAHIEEALEDLAIHPSTAKYVSYKLARRFLSDEPPAEAVESMAAAWISSGGYLPKVYEALIVSAEQHRFVGLKIRMPEDYVIAGIRACQVFLNQPQSIEFDASADIIGEYTNFYGTLPERGPTLSERQGGAALGATQLRMANSMENRMEQRNLSASDSEPVISMRDNTDSEYENYLGKLGWTARQANPITIRALNQMNQPVWAPPGPHGWDDDKDTWLTPQGLSTRIDWAVLMGDRYGAAVADRVPSIMAERGASIVEYNTVTSASTASKQLALALASPAFNRS